MEWKDYTASGNYEFFTVNSAGCDSIAYLEVQINEPTASREIVDACEEFVWNGEVYNESGVYSYSTFNSVGCDSIATLDLMIYGDSPTNVVVEKKPAMNSPGMKPPIQKAENILCNKQRVWL